MKPEQLALLDTASSELLQALNIAHWRYISLIGIVFDVLPAVIVASDRKAYPQFIKSDIEHAVFNKTDCIAFMAEVSHLAPQLCEAWMNYDAYAVQRETSEETGKRPKPYGVH